MREVKKPLEKLVIDPRLVDGRKESLFEDVYNLRPGMASGAVPYVALSDPLSQTVIWPFPQVLFGNTHGLLLGHSVSHFTGAFAITPIDILADEVLWDVADFGPYLIGSNGAHTYAFVEASPITVSLLSTGSSPTAPDLMSVCDFRGIVIGGGVLTSWYDCDEKSVIWSRPGQVNFNLDRHNLSGYYANAGIGAIQKVLPLRRGFLALGKEGMAFFGYSETGAFGYEKLNCPGISWKGAAQSDRETAIFIGNDGYLWRTDGQKVEKLGYYNEVSGLSSPVITYDETYRDFFIADADESFVLSETGMFRCFQSPTGIGKWGGNHYGCFAASSDQSAKLVSNPLDFGFRGKKSFSGIYSAFRSSATATCRYHYRYGQGAYSQTPYAPLSPAGTSGTICTADDVKIELKFSTYNVNIDYLGVGFKLSDYHATRGINAD